MPEKANYRIMGGVQNVPGDGTNKKCEVNPACETTSQKPTFAEIVRKVRSTARR